MKKRYLNLFLFLLCLAVTFASVPQSAFGATANQLKSKVISVAENEVGYKGTSSKSKYGDWYGYQGSWCTYFIFWCYNQADKSMGSDMYGTIVPSGGNCNSMISWYKNKGLYHKSGSYKPQKGDLVFFDWSSNGSSQHVGFVTGTSGSTVFTIEGNCSGEVKSRQYTSTGSKPYNNISSIMGYASPKYSSASGSSSSDETEKKETETKKSQESKETTKKKSSSSSSSSSSSNKSEKDKTTKASTTKKESKDEEKQAEKLTLHAATNTLELGDSVTLEYNVEPTGSKAVVGYFCDEEGVIEIGEGGNITAVGKGTATVVVCANDSIYSQCDFTVTDVSRDVTIQSDTQEENAPELSDKNIPAELKLRSFISAATAWITSREPYVWPAVAVGAFGVIGLIILCAKSGKKK